MLTRDHIVSCDISACLTYDWITSGMRLLLICTVSPHLARYSFPIPLRAGGWVSLGSWLHTSVLFLSHPRSEGWPHHERTFSIYLYPLSFWLTLPQRVLSTTWCCLSRPCVVFLACVHLALFLALFLSPGNSLVSSWCDHSMIASSLWQCLTVLSLLQLCWEPTHFFSLLVTYIPRRYTCERSPMSVLTELDVQQLCWCAGVGCLDLTVSMDG